MSLLLRVLSLLLALAFVVLIYYVVVWVLGLLGIVVPVVILRVVFVIIALLAVIAALSGRFWPGGTPPSILALCCAGAAVAIAAESGGCASRAEVINVRETLWNGTAQIRARDLQQATTRPAAEQAAIREVHKNLQEFVNQSRSHDSSWISKTP